MWFSIYHAFLADLMAKKSAKQMKREAVLFELADIANALCTEPRKDKLFQYLPEKKLKQKELEKKSKQ